MSPDNSLQLVGLPSGVLLWDLREQVGQSAGMRGQPLIEVFPVGTFSEFVVKILASCEHFGAVVHYSRLALHQGDTHGTKKVTGCSSWLSLLWVTGETQHFPFL